MVDQTKHTHPAQSHAELLAELLALILLLWTLLQNLQQTNLITLTWGEF